MWKQNLKTIWLLYGKVMTMARTKINIIVGSLANRTTGAK